MGTSPYNDSIIKAGVNIWEVNSLKDTLKAFDYFQNKQQKCMK